MIIHESSNVPDNTYFTTGDTEPEINNDGSLTIYDGKGTYRSSWGAPGVTSTVILDDDDLVAVHVGFHHKHGGGQFWRYYTTDGTETRQIEWRQIPDEARQRILDAAKRFAPSWAKAPGKLRAQYAKPALRTMTSYKLVRLEANGSLRSLYDGSTEYQIGKRLAQRAEAGHGGGWYSQPTQAQVMALWNTGALVPDRCVVEGVAYALIECEIGGTIIRYDNGKLSSTYLTPLRVVETFVHQPAAMAA